MNIEYWRNEIDDVDRELLQLLNRRARLAMKVGALKRTAGLPSCDPEREQVVLQTLQQANTGPLDRRAITKLFRRIIRETRRVQTVEPVSHGERSVDKLRLIRQATGSREAAL
ncbi:MAG TPA: chorismate mutase [Pyrinomonadaceae bacterium]|nr:chorismate mutase [Pyrinomonadaceae bacterium]